MLNKNGKTGHSCLLPDLRGHAFSLSLLTIMLGGGVVIYGLYYAEVWSLYAHFQQPPPFFFGCAVACGGSMGPGSVEPVRKFLTYNNHH